LDFIVHVDDFHCLHDQGFLVPQSSGQEKVQCVNNERYGKVGKVGQVSSGSTSPIDSLLERAEFIGEIDLKMQIIHIFFHIKF